jgi:hypothetical protein
VNEYRTTTKLRLNKALVMALTAVLPVAATAGPLPADKCEAGKNKIAGAYYACLEKAESTAILKATMPDYSKCTAKFLDKWDSAEDKGAGTCPDTIAVTQDMADYLKAQAAEAASVVGGADIPTCAADLASCQNALAACATGCDAPLPCPAPSASHQTICGQLYDLEDGAKFQAVGATGTQCTTTTADGPCSLDIVAYDALAFGMDPMTATPLTSDPVYIDDCGRFRVSDLTVPSGPFVELAIDDADLVDHGPTGSTNTVGVSLAKQTGAATANVDGWIASKATTDTWELSGSPPVSGGLFVPIFYESIATTSRDLQDDVTMTSSGNPIPLQDNYFVATETARHTIDAAATATGANGTVLVTSASVAESSVYSGSGGGLPASCVWETHTGASLPSILSVQSFRPKDAVAQTCDR